MQYPNYDMSGKRALVTGGGSEINREISADPGLKEQFLAKIPLGRMAKPEEIASLMVYLSTDAAAFITGTSIVADGGATIDG